MKLPRTHQRFLHAGKITAQSHRYHSLEFDFDRVELDSLALTGLALAALDGARRGVETESTIRPLPIRSLSRASSF